MLVRPVQLAAAGALALAVTASPLPADAQVNAEALRSQLKRTPRFVWLDGSLVTRAGNVSGSVAGASIFTGITHERHVVFSRAQGDYTEFDGEAQVARYTVHARYGYTVLPWLMPEALWQVQHDRFRRLLFREVQGLGPRFVLVQERELELFWAVTYLLESEVLAAEGSDPRRFDVWHRASTYAGANVEVTPGATLSTVTYLQPRIDDASDYRILHETWLTVDVTKVLALRLGVSFRYDHDPPSGVKPGDLEVKNSLVFKL